MNKVILTSEEQVLTGRTEVAKAFNKRNFDKLLQPNNVIGLETYITYNKKQIEGFELRKTHSDKKTPTTYFMRSEDVQKLPVMIVETMKIHDKGRVYHLVIECETMEIPREKVYTWRELVDYSGMPKEAHSNQLHHILYKNKMLFSRLRPHVYSRIITESAFGKTKYLEWVRACLDHTSMVSDPSPPKLFYASCHTRFIIINELPDDTVKASFIKTCNMLMNLGDGTNDLDNPSRATKGTSETADTSMTSLVFTHNPPKYYQDLGSRTFEEIYPYNVVNRFYYNYYTGYLSPRFPEHMDFEALADHYSDFFKGMISTMLYFEVEWGRLPNKFPRIDLEQYFFPERENRFRTHFFEFAKALSHYASDESQYKALLDEEYKSHQAYRVMIANDCWKESFKGGK